MAATGLAVLVAVLAGAVGNRSATAPPPLPTVAATPAPPPPPRARRPAASAGAIVARPTSAQQRAAVRSLSVPHPGVDGAPVVHIPRRWMEGFYPIYGTAQATFGVNWLLLASIHMQESAFSTAPGTYAGLNFAGCCGGPMQFNVTNGPVTTWDLVKDSYIYGRRPAHYDHMTAKHPSIYDDFDAVMAAARLLSADGAAWRWTARRGTPPTTITATTRPASPTRTACWLARSAGHSTASASTAASSSSLVAAVHAAYGAPVQAALEASSARSQAGARRTARSRAAARARSHAADRRDGPPPSSPV